MSLRERELSWELFSTPPDTNGVWLAPNNHCSPHRNPSMERHFKMATDPPFHGEGATSLLGGATRQVPHPTRAIAPPRAEGYRSRTPTQTS